MIILLISGKSYDRTVSALMPQDPDSNLNPHSAELSKMSWKTFQGEVRSYVKTRNILSGIMEEYKVSGVSIVLTQRNSISSRVRPITYYLYMGVENPHTGKPIDG